MIAAGLVCYATWRATQAFLDADHCPHTDGFRLPTSTQEAIRSLAERLYAERDARTVFIGDFFFVLGLVSLGVNFVLTPLKGFDAFAIGRPGA